MILNSEAIKKEPLYNYLYAFRNKLKYPPTVPLPEICSEDLPNFAMRKHGDCKELEITSVLEFIKLESPPGIICPLGLSELVMRRPDELYFPCHDFVYQQVPECVKRILPIDEDFKLPEEEVKFKPYPDYAWKTVEVSLALSDDEILKEVHEKRQLLEQRQREYNRIHEWNCDAAKHLINESLRERREAYLERIKEGHTVLTPEHDAFRKFLLACLTETDEQIRQREMSEVKLWATRLSCCTSDEQKMNLWSQYEARKQVRQRQKEWIESKQVKRIITILEQNKKPLRFCNYTPEAEYQVQYIHDGTFKRSSLWFNCETTQDLNENSKLRLGENEEHKVIEDEVHKSLIFIQNIKRVGELRISSQYDLPRPFVIVFKRIN